MNRHAKTVIALMIAAVGFSGSCLSAADPAPAAAKAPTAADLARAEQAAHIKSLDERLRSGKPEDEQQAIDELKTWLSDDAKSAKDAPDILLRLQTAISNPKRATDALALAQLVLPKVPEERADQRRELTSMQIRSQMRLKQFDAGMAAYKKLLAVEGPGQLHQLGEDLQAYLFAGQRYHDVEDLSVQLILAKPEDTPRVEGALQTQIKAFNLEKRYDKALAASKQLLWVSTMPHTGEALLAVARQLALAHPEDKDIVEKFRQEQIDGAKPTTEPTDVVRTSAVLPQIKVDATPYEAAVKDIVDGDYDSQMRLGNLLLLTDKPKEAKVAFETALALSMDKQGAASTAAEGVARSIRAHDGTVCRANAFAMSVSSGK